MKTVLITGASSGIGATCALHLDKLGWKVFAGVRKSEDGEALQHRSSAHLNPVLLDITNPTHLAQVRTSLNEALDGAGLDGLVNNAAITTVAPVEYLALEDLRQVLEVNIVAQVGVIQTFLPLLRLAKGRIVNIGSISGRSSAPTTGAYSASKFGLEGLTDALRMELLPWQMNVSIVEPGSIATPFGEKAVAITDRLLATLPAEGLERYGQMLRTTQKVVGRVSTKGTPVIKVALAVEHALTAQKPKTRYLVGRVAWLRFLVQKLPDRLGDQLIVTQLKRLA